MLMKYYYWTFIFHIVICEATDSKDKKIEESIRQYGNDGVGITYYPLGLNAGKDPPSFTYDGNNVNYLGYPQFETPINHRVVKKSTVTKKENHKSEPKLIIRVKSKKLKDKIKDKKPADIKFSKKIFAKFNGNLKDGLKSKVTANFNNKTTTTGTAKDMVNLIKKISQLFKTFGKHDSDKSTSLEDMSSDKPKHNKNPVSKPPPPPRKPISSSDRSTSSESKSKSASSESKTSKSSETKISSIESSERSDSFSVKHYKRVHDPNHIPLGILKTNKLHPLHSKSSKDMKDKNMKPLYLKNVQFDEILIPRKKHYCSKDLDSSSFSVLSKSFDISSSSETESSSSSSESFPLFDLSKYKKYNKYSKKFKPHYFSHCSASDESRKKTKYSRFETYKQPKMSLLKIHQRSIPKNQITIIPKSGAALEKSVQEKDKINENKEEKKPEAKDRVKRNEYRLRGHYESHTGQPFGHFTDLNLPHVANNNNLR